MAQPLLAIVATSILLIRLTRAARAPNVTRPEFGLEVAGADFAENGLGRIGCLRCDAAIADQDMALVAP